MDATSVAAAEKLARLALKDRKLEVLETLLWATDFRTEALERANSELAKPIACECSAGLSHNSIVSIQYFVNILTVG